MQSLVRLMLYFRISGMTVFFKNNQPITLVGLFITHLLLWLPSFMEPPLPLYRYEPVFWMEIAQGMTKATFGPIILVLLGFLCSFASVVYFNFLCRKYELLPRSSFVPGFMFSLTSATICTVDTFYPAHLSMLVLLYLTHRIFRWYKSESANREIYETGMIGGSLAFLQADFFILFFFIPVLLATIRVFDIREFILLIVGFFTPIYFIGTLYFLTDFFPTYWEAEGWHFLSRNRPAIPNEEFLLLGLFGLLMLCYLLGILRAALQRNRLILKTRKYYNVIHLLTVSLILVAVSSGPLVSQSMVYLVLPIALYATYFFLDQDLYLPKEIALMVIYLGCLVLRFYHHFFDLNALLKQYV